MGTALKTCCSIEVASKAQLKAQQRFRDTERSEPEIHTELESDTEMYIGLVSLTSCAPILDALKFKPHDSAMDDQMVLFRHKSTNICAYALDAPRAEWHFACADRLSQGTLDAISSSSMPRILSETQITSRDHNWRLFWRIGSDIAQFGLLCTSHCVRSYSVIPRGVCLTRSSTRRL